MEGSTCQLGLFNSRIVGGVAFLAWCLFEYQKALCDYSIFLRCS